MDKLQLSITIKDSEKTIFDGFARAVSSISNVGKFDVLPNHANFIALIQEQITVYDLDPNKKPQIVPVEEGVMKVKENEIKVILGVKTKATEASSKIK